MKKIIKAIKWFFSERCDHCGKPSDELKQVEQFMESGWLLCPKCMKL